MSINIPVHPSEFKLFVHWTGKLYKTGPFGNRAASPLDVALYYSAFSQNVEAA